MIDGIEKKCPCCGMTNLDHFKMLHAVHDAQAKVLFDYQNEHGDYSDESIRAAAQASADTLAWVIERLEGRGGCL